MVFHPSFSATFQFEKIRRQYDLCGEIRLFKPRYNIQPAQYVPVILRGERGNDAKLMKWGLVPSWVREISMWEGLPYAQAETLLEKRSFKQLVDSRRCLIPADGFYEWRNDWRKKTPIWFHLKGKKPFAFAGLWDSWRNVELGDTIETFTIITTTANALIRPIRNRMPVVFDKESGDQWLDSRFGMFSKPLNCFGAISIGIHGGLGSFSVGGVCRKRLPGMYQTRWRYEGRDNTTASQSIGCSYCLAFRAAEEINNGLATFSRNSAPSMALFLIFGPLANS